MPAIQLYSRLLAKKIKAQLKNTIQNRLQQGFRAPKLVMVLIGNHLPSVIYVRNKKKACEQVGILSQIIECPSTYSEEALLTLIRNLNQESTIDGILVQLPLPKTMAVHRILKAIDPNKDVDGFHPYNLGLLAQGNPHFRACTPYGIMRLLETLPNSLRGLHAVVVGASNIVGKPMALELLQVGCTVTICHIATQPLWQHVSQADLLVSAIGKTGVIKSDWIKPGAIVIDAGINYAASGELTGDIEFKTALSKAYAITPVPGGVGPMTVAMLMENTWKSYQLHNPFNH